MIIIQAVPKTGLDAYKLLRDKVTHEAETFYWGNKAKTKLCHVAVKKGYIEIGGVDGVLVGHVHPVADTDPFKLTEKFIGRFVAWFKDDIVSINIQFVDDKKKKTKNK